MRDPGGAAVCNGAEDEQELAHDSGEGQFAGLATASQSLVEALEMAIVTNGGEGSHVQGLARPPRMER